MKKRLMSMLVLVAFMCLSTVVFAQNNTPAPQPVPDKTIAADKAAPAGDTVAKDKKPVPEKKAVHKKHVKKTKKSKKSKKVEKAAPATTPAPKSPK